MIDLTFGLLVFESICAGVAFILIGIKLYKQDKEIDGLKEFAVFPNLAHGIDKERDK